MAFEFVGAVVAEGALETLGADAAFELMPTILSSTFEGSQFALPELLGGESLTPIFGSEAVTPAIQQAVTPAAQSVVEGGVGSGEGITSTTRGALQTGAATTPTPTPGADSVLNAPNVNPSLSNPGYSGTGLNPTLSSPSPFTAAPSAFEQGLGAISKFASNYPFLTGAGIYGIAGATGMLDQKRQEFSAAPKKQFNNPYHLSPDFKGYNPNSQPYNVDYSKYAGVNNYAEGGIAGYYRGDLATSNGQRGDVYGATSRFLDMYDPSSRYTPPADATHPDVGIFHDTNPSTRSKSALQAAGIRNKAIANRADVKTSANYIPPSRQMGQLNFTLPGGKADQETDNDSVLNAAHGGIMGASLGSYAAGGNPRLLKGPGDGMSDNIPATIGNAQPARLADGEFVVPADVVSGLGNGSTDAGAKRLHEMMDKVRVARTGNKKQGKKINPNKYTPK